MVNYTKKSSARVAARSSEGLGERKARGRLLEI
jgi:hypothetical protein